MMRYYEIIVCLHIAAYFNFINFGNVLSLPLDNSNSVAWLDGNTDTKAGGGQNWTGQPVWSHGFSMAEADATGENSILITDAWSEVNNNGGLQVETVTSNGTVIGHQVVGTTNCSQESYASASGSETANAVAYGLCNSIVLLDNPVSNQGYNVSSN